MHFIINFLNNKSDRYYFILIAALCFVVFGNTLSHDFAWDDKIVIQQNDRVQSGLKNFSEFFVKYKSDRLQDKYGYRPVTLISFAIDKELYSNNASGFHFTQVLLYSILCISLFLFCRQLIPDKSPALSFAIVLLFLVHPLHTEVVANIKSRDELFALLFGILSTYFFLKTYRERRLVHLFLAALFFLLAYLSKENAIVFLAIVPLTLLLFNKIDWKKIILPASILAGLGIVSIIILKYAETSTAGSEITQGLGAFNESLVLGNGLFYHNYFLADKLANSSQLVALYLKDFLLPYPLVYFHGPDYVVFKSWTSPLVILGFIFSLTGIAFSIYSFRKYPLLSFGILFFFISLSVYLMLFIQVSDAMADRFMFTPSFGLCLALIGAIVEVYQKNEENIKSKSGVIFYVFATYIIVLSLLTWNRNKVWKNDFTLVSNDIEYLENSSKPNYYYATELNKILGSQGYDPILEKEMIDHYKRSIALSDSAYYARLDLAKYFHSQEKFKESISLYKNMINTYPKASDAYFYLGKVYVQNGKYNLATEYLNKAIRYSPKSYDSYYLKALSLSRMRQFENAEKLLNNCLDLFPEHKNEFYEILSENYFNKGNMEQSAYYSMERLKLGANPYTVYARIISRFQDLGDEESARNYYLDAVQKGIMK